MHMTLILSQSSELHDYVYMCDIFDVSLNIYEERDVRRFTLPAINRKRENGYLIRVRPLMKYI